tara:strand:- start:647 stop:841 length:195 start_codon:yes stop_codon:yes gene_type:complete
MSNYPDNMGDDSHLDSDETGNKLSCGCYEECCECPRCIVCHDKLDNDEEHLHIICEDCNEDGEE